MEICFINMLLHFYHTIIVLYKDFLCLYFKINLSNWVIVAELELQKNVMSAEHLYDCRN